MSQPDDGGAAKAAKPAYELSHEPPTGSANETARSEQSPGAPPPPEQDPYAVLRIPLYRYFVASYFMAVVGGQVQMAAIDWELYQRTNSAIMLGLLGLVQFLPVVLLSLPAGQAADIYDRRRILIIGQLVLAFCGLCMMADSLFLHGANHATSFAVIALSILTVNSITMTFARPCRSSILPHIVPAKLFSKAVMWNSSLFEIACVIGPAAGGLLIRYGTPICYLINAVFLVVCCLLTLPLPHVRVKSKQRTTFKTLVAGVKFVFHTDLLISTMTLDLFAVLVGGVTYLLPIFATNILHVGPTGYGWLRSAPAVGAFAMAIFVAHAPPMKNAGRNLLLAVAGFGAATLVFGLSKNYWLSLAMLFLTGAFDNISVVVRQTLVQMITPDEMRGRVSAVNQVFIGSSNQLGGFESGVTAAAWGAPISVVVGGIGTLLVILGIAFKWPALRRLGRLDEIQPAKSE